MPSFFIMLCFPIWSPIPRGGGLDGLGPWALQVELVLLGALYLFIENGEAWLGLDIETLENIRYFCFYRSMVFGFFHPHVFRTSDAPKNDTPVGQVIQEGLQQLKNSIKQARKYANIYRFLARMIYNDAIILIYALAEYKPQEPCTG